MAVGPSSCADHNGTDWRGATRAVSGIVDRLSEASGGGRSRHHSRMLKDPSTDGHEARTENTRYCTLVGSAADLGRTSYVVEPGTGGLLTTRKKLPH